MNEPERAPEAVLAEAVPLLALMATRGLYAEQPALWELGEHGRARTVEDFTHHFRALALLRTEAFRQHVAYCEDLFARRNFPRRWLDDAWRWMARTLRGELPPDVAQAALAVLRDVTGVDAA